MDQRVNIVTKHGGVFEEWHLFFGSNGSRRTQLTPRLNSCAARSRHLRVIFDVQKL